MDNLTHTLFAATLARTPLADAGRGTTAALLLASNAPDVDVVSTAGGAVSYMQWHRGPTHGLLGVVALGVLTAAVVWCGMRVLDRRRPDRETAPAASFALLVAVSLLGVALHILMDLPTSYGTRLLSPFDWHWYAFDWLPIIDVYLLAALGVGLLVGTIGDKAARRRMAAVVLALMAANYGLRAVAHHQALVRAPQLFGPLLPRACDPEMPVMQNALAVWPTPRGTSAATVAAPAGAARPCLLELAAMPTFVSPFRWRLVAHLSNAYELHEVDLLDARLHDESGAADRMWRLTLRYPDQWTPATARAAASRTAALFLGFSRFPAARTFTDPTGAATVRWTDVRFVGGWTSMEDRSRRPNPFNVVVRLDPAGRVIDQHSGE